jgi:hypothetical protein
MPLGKQLSLVSVLTLLFAVTGAGVARANLTLGSTAMPAGSSPGPCNGAVVAQVASDSTTPYTVPSKGTISAWQMNTVAGTPGTPATLVVLRPVSGPTYTVVGVNTHALPSPLPTLASFTVPSPIGVNGGELLGVYSPGASVSCFFGGGSTPATDALIAMGSVGTPVAGQTLLVTEPASGPGLTLNLAATLKPPAHKKKCKKKKHSAESAKKKKCKKKKKR